MTSARSTTPSLEAEQAEAQPAPATERRVLLPVRGGVAALESGCGWQAEIKLEPGGSVMEAQAVDAAALPETAVDSSIFASSQRRAGSSQRKADILPAAVLWAMVSVAADMLKLDRSLTLGRILYDTACKGRDSTKRGLGKGSLEAAVATFAQQHPAMFTGVNRAVFKNPESPQFQCADKGAGRMVLPWRFDDADPGRAWTRRPRSMTRMAGWAWMVLHSCADLTMQRLVDMLGLGDCLPEGLRDLSSREPAFFEKVYQQALDADRSTKKGNKGAVSGPKLALSTGGRNGEQTTVLNGNAGSGISIYDSFLLCEFAWADFSPSTQREAQLLTTLRKMHLACTDAHARAARAEQELANLRARYCGGFQPASSFRNESCQSSTANVRSLLAGFDPAVHSDTRQNVKIEVNDDDGMGTDTADQRAGKRPRYDACGTAPTSPWLGRSPTPHDMKPTVSGLVSGAADSGPRVQSTYPFSSYPCPNTPAVRDVHQTLNAVML